MASGVSCAPCPRFKSMLGRRYPFDPPLTLTGAKQAKSVAKELWDGATVASRLGQRPEVCHDLATVFWDTYFFSIFFSYLFHFFTSEVDQELFAKYGDFSVVVSSPFIRCWIDTQRWVFWGGTKSQKEWWIYIGFTGVYHKFWQFSVGK